MYAAAYVWAKVLGRLEQQLTDVTVATWFEDAQVVDFTEDTLILYTPSPLRKDVIRERWSSYITQAVQELFQMDVTLEVYSELPRQHQELSRQITPDDRYSFDSFIEGDGNRFAKQVTMLAAAHPGENTHNPLFLYGDTGVGKTHLLYAAANALAHDHPHLKVVCMKAETFTTELVQAIRQGNVRAFKDKYRNADVLLLDDIQFIAGKDATQEEFFHTFNALYESNRQIILTADRRPGDMATLADRLVDRFGEGIMVQVQAPDEETRRRILQAKARDFGLTLDEQIIEYLASRVTMNVRQIEGVLKKIRAYRDLSNMPMTVEAIGNALEHIEHSPKQITAEGILLHVCKYYGVDGELLKGPQRSRAATEPRQIAMYLMRKLTAMSLEDIARCFGRDRATVLHSLKKIQQTLALKNNPLKPILEEITANIYG